MEPQKSTIKKNEVQMRIREWRNDAWAMATHNGYPGCVSIVEKAMQFGYQLGLKDATEELAELRNRIAKTKEKANAPRP